MERPLCPLCRTKHYAREAHVFKESTPQPKIAVHASAPSGEGVGRVEVAGFDRVAYQREYMREYRARKAFKSCQ